jgi:pyrimidine-specific ribonucleoside hydrolase
MTSYKLLPFCHKLVIPGLLFLFLAGVLPATAQEAKKPIIIDTDVALDDLRALTLFLSDGNFQLMAVVTSDGSCSPEQGAFNIRKVLGFLGAENVPVGAGRKLDAATPPWRPMSEAMGWTDLPGNEINLPTKTSLEILDEVAQTIDQPLIYVCLGPLSNLAELLQSSPSVKYKIRAVYYYGTLFTDTVLSWNTDRDTTAAKEVLYSGLPIYTCGGADSLLLTFNKDLYDSLCTMTTPEADFLCRLHANERVQSLLKNDHFTAWDETVALSLIAPAVVEFQPVDSSNSLYALEYFDRRIAREVYLQTLEQGGPLQWKSVKQ